METPLSTRRITRSLAAAEAAQKSATDSAAQFTRPKNAGAGERAALHDITNDSPIVGLAASGLHGKTPASTATKTRPRPRRTPGSGEALLRGQVKALLHKVHEQKGPTAAAALVRPPARIQALLGVTRSPAQLLAPTPANTPQLGFGVASRVGLLLPDGSTVMPCVLEEEEALIPELQVIAASLPPSPIEESLSEGQLHRALVFDDSPGKSDSSNSASLKFHDSSSTASHVDKSSSSTEDDSSSAWSIQVHSSSEKGDDEEVGEELGEYSEEEEEVWGEGSGDECFDDLCEEMSKITVIDEEEKAGLPQFKGKHTRFIYNSDDEIEREEVVPSAEMRAELGTLLLRGVPVPKGRHLRFHEDEEDED